MDWKILYILGIFATVFISSGCISDHESVRTQIATITNLNEQIDSTRTNVIITHFINSTPLQNRNIKSDTLKSTTCPPFQLLCNGICYNPNYDSCCLNKIYKGTNWTQCNSKDCYNLDFKGQSCCDGKLYSGTYIYCGYGCIQPNYLNPGCCKGEIFNRDTHTCCDLFGVVPGKIDCDSIRVGSRCDDPSNPSGIKGFCKKGQSCCGNICYFPSQARCV